MSKFDTKNYADTNGDRFVVGGEIAIQTPGKITRDGVEIKKMVAQANSAAGDVPTLVTDFNSLLQKLRDAGLMS